MPPLSTQPSLTWFAVETRPRAEYAALADLTAMGFEVYLPQETRLRRTRKGRIPAQHPLMPGFLFVGVQDRSIFDVLRSRAVRSIVRSPGGGAHPIRPRIVSGQPFHFVEDMRTRETAGEFDSTPRTAPLVKGGEARVLSGAFKDSIGKLLAAPANGRAEIMLKGLFGGRMTVDVRSLEGIALAA